MHHCFLIHEILERIAWAVWEDMDLALPIYQTPLAFALTCRVFLDPGLDILWHYIDNPRPLAYAFRATIEPIFCGDLEAEFDDFHEEAEFPPSVSP